MSAILTLRYIDRDEDTRQFKNTIQRMGDIYKSSPVKWIVQFDRFAWAEDRPPYGIVMLDLKNAELYRCFGYTVQQVCEYIISWYKQHKEKA